jgi:hypothetical protein
MKHLFDSAAADELRARLARLGPDCQRQWGTMTPAQAMAHCAISLEMALGDRLPPRMFVGRIIGGLVKRLALGDARPLKKNTPTSPDLVVADDRELGTERRRVRALVDRFAAGGPSGCTTHPHTFFGRLTPEEWSVLMYKHLDHHLRQFGV